MSERRPRVRAAAAARGLLGVAALVVPAGAAWASGSALTAGHPAYPVLLLVVALAGAVLVLRRAAPVRAGRARAAGRGAAAVLLVLLLPAVHWLRPHLAGPAGQAAARTSDRVQVVHTPGSWELRPTSTSGVGTGLVFLPGALVDPRAYLPLLRPLAERGVRVVVPAPPFGLAFADPSAVSRAVTARPETRTWVVGGHSLGGVAAASAVDVPGMRGLLLWASYPAGDLSSAPVAVLSLSGERDGLTTPDDIARTRPLLPPGTRFVQIPGGTHAFFGDYGVQRGDGEPGADREDVARRIVDETVHFVQELPVRSG